MATTQSLYELKQDKFKQKNKNVITDADYFLRDKAQEAQEGNPNTIDMTPPLVADYARIDQATDEVEPAKEPAKPLTPKAPASKAKV